MSKLRKFFKDIAGTASQYLTKIRVNRTFPRFGGKSSD
jgi:hypothetical protein